MPVRNLSFAPAEPVSEEQLARWEVERIEEERRQAEYNAMVEVLYPIVYAAFPAGWRYGNPRYAGDFDIEQCWSERTGEFNMGTLRLNCPGCRRRIAPFQTRSLVGLNGGLRWVGLDHQEPYTDYLVACGWCGDPILFTVHVPQ